MESDLAYLRRRAKFHQRMARRATCVPARHAHDALARAYLARLEKARTDRGAGSTDASAGETETKRARSSLQCTMAETEPA